MRTLTKVKIPTAAGNEAIKNGSLPEIIGKALATLNAEAAYFTSEDGMRTAPIFFDMADSSDIPLAAEPFHGLRPADHVRARDERGRRHACRRRQGDGGRLAPGVLPSDVPAICLTVGTNRTTPLCWRGTLDHGPRVRETVLKERTSRADPIRIALPEVPSRTGRSCPQSTDGLRPPARMLVVWHRCIQSSGSRPDR
jgi:hypothetical protein